MNTEFIKLRAVYAAGLILAGVVAVLAYGEFVRVLHSFDDGIGGLYWSVSELVLGGLAALLAATGCSLCLMVEARLGRKRLGLTVVRSDGAPKRHEWLALVSAIVGFFPVGIAAVAYAVGVDTALASDDRWLAERRSRLALGLSVASFLVGAVIWVGLIWFFVGPNAAPIRNQ